MAVTRKIDEFQIFDIESWGGNRFYIAINDPEDVTSAAIVVTLPELKAISKELKAAIKELEGK